MSGPPPPSANATRRLLDTARTGRGMTWVIAIMLFLTVLAGAAGIGTARAAQALGARLEGRVTVEAPVADPARRGERARAVSAALGTVAGVSDVRVVPAAELARLLGPWLGDDADAAELPVPVLVDLSVSDAAVLERVRAALAPVAPDARLDLHDQALRPLRGLLAGLVALAAALVALMGIATAVVVVLAARAGLEAHRGTIEVMHMLGSTDVQVARLFQRRIARDAALGAAVGAGAGLATVALLGVQAGSLGSELLGTVTLGRGGWAVLALLPFLFVVLAALIARRAVVRALGRVL